MRTSLNSTQETEHYLNGQLSTEDRLIYQARLIVEEGLEEQTRWQKKTYAIVHAYGRMQFRNQLTKIHEQLMTEPQHHNFRNKILHFFSR
jgi:hypothetical protein